MKTSEKKNKNEKADVVNKKTIIDIPSAKETKELKIKDSKINKTKKSASTKKKTDIKKESNKKNSFTKATQLPPEILENPNVSPIFDVFFYREMFMALRTEFDAIYEKREKSDKDFDAYDDAIYNITVSAIDNAGAQDFLSYCYKKGKYDFCLMNYEKFMKWGLLSAANGNAFTLSKLQIFLNNSIETLLSSDIHSYVIAFLELSEENYILFLSKLICTEMVNLLKITPTNLAKMPEVYMEQNEQIQRVFDDAKIKATEQVIESIKQINEQLKEYVELQSQEEKLLKKKIKPQDEDLKEEPKAESKQTDEDLDSSKSASKEKRKPKVKKFRW